MVAVVAVVVVAIVLLTLVLTGLIPLFGHSHSPRFETFASARGSAVAAASSHSGGPWTVVAAIGISSTSTIQLPSQGFPLQPFSASQCTVTPESGAPSSYYVPAASVSANGSLPLWLSLFANSSGTLMFVGSESGSSQVLGVTSDIGCPHIFSGFGAVPTTVIDSNAAAAAANAAGGSAFLSANPHANTSMAIVGSFPFPGVNIPSSWEVAYLDCPFDGSGPATAPGFTATVNALNGTVIHSGSASIQCPVPPSRSGTSLGSVLAVGQPAVSANGSGYIYRFAVQSAGGGLLYDNLNFQVQTSAGTILPVIGMQLSVEDLTGATIAVDNLAAGYWSSGGNVPVTASQDLRLDSTSVLSGTILVVSATGAFQGSITQNIP